MYTYDKCYYVYNKDEQGLTVLALLEEEFNKRLGFQFIDHVSKDILKAYPRQELSYKKQNGLIEFQPMIRTLFENYNSSFIDKSKLALNEVTDLKEQVSINLQKIFERNRQMEELNSQVELLSDNSMRIMGKVIL